uniref:Hydroxysteroid (17-beta) dehydrogenase 8 n=1 Tax=Oncorhynchus tshawytscha TaxID=74940 RepID=A0A8C8ITR8_ONCTS
MPTTTRLISRLTDITAICQQFTSEGATVVVADIREESALGILNHGHKGQDHITAAVDVSIKGECREKLEICRYFQPPSVCVNAAGVTQDDFSLKMEDEDFGKVTQATFLLTKAVGKALVASGAPKRSIIAVGSIVGKSDILTNGPPVTGHYRFNCLPGFITTPMTDKLTSMVPLGRMGEPAGRNTVYTTLYDSGYITGNSVEVAGNGHTCNTL